MASGQKRSVIFLTRGVLRRYSGKFNWIHRTAALLSERGYDSKVGVVGACSGAIRNRNDSLLFVWPSKKYDPDNTVLVITEDLVPHANAIQASKKVLLLRHISSLALGKVPIRASFDMAITFSESGAELLDYFGMKKDNVLAITEAPYPEFFTNFKGSDQKEKRLLVRTVSESAGTVVYEALRQELTGTDWMVMPIGFVNEAGYMDSLARASIVVDVPYDEGSYMTLVEAALSGCMTVGWDNAGVARMRYVSGFHFVKFGRILSVIDTTITLTKRADTEDYDPEMISSGTVQALRVNNQTVDKEIDSIIEFLDLK